MSKLSMRSWKIHTHFSRGGSPGIWIHSIIRQQRRK